MRVSLVEASTEDFGSQDIAAGGGEYACEAHAQVIEYDPATITVAWTATSLYWTKIVGPGAHECADWSWGQCNPISPTQAGTNWYNFSPCQITPVTYDQPQPFSAQTIGHYYNWDFPPPSLFTYVDHINLIKRQNHATQFQWSAVESGQAAWLLHGEIVTSQACY